MIAVADLNRVFKNVGFVLCHFLRLRFDNLLLEFFDFVLVHLFAHDVVGLLLLAPRRSISFLLVIELHEFVVEFVQVLHLVLAREVLQFVLFPLAHVPLFSLNPHLHDCLPIQEPSHSYKLVPSLRIQRAAVTFVQF